MIRKLLGAAVLLAACTPPPVMQPPVRSPDCAISLPAEALTAKQGERLSLPITLGADVTRVWLEQLVTLSDAVEGTTLKVTMPSHTASAKVILGSTCEGQDRTTPFNFTVTPLRWTRAAEWAGTSGPSAREYFAMWLDPVDPKRLFVFGGFVYQPRQFTPNSELWELNRDTTAWTQHMATGTPPAVSGGRVAVAPDGQSALYLGGLDVGAMATPYVLQRLTLGTAPSWTAEPTAANSGRGDYQPGFFYDAKRGRFLSLCGVNADTGYHCDLREFVPSATGGAWRTITVSGPVPDGRNGHAYAWDAETDRVVLFGGDVQGGVLSDTWVLDLAPTTPTWRKISDASPIAIGRRNMAFVLDSTNHRFLIWGGTANGRDAVPGLFSLDLTAGNERWDEVDTIDTPPARASGAAVFDPASRRALMGFGNTIDGNYADLWSLEL